MACPLRVAFSQDSSFNEWRRPSLASSLGIVAHAVTERVLTGDWTTTDDDAMQRIGEIWIEEVSKQEKEMVSRWTPAKPPQPEEWPGYFLTRTRTIRRLIRYVADKSKASIDSRFPRTTIYIEHPLMDPVSGLYGRPDRVDRTSSGIRISDLKTGLNQQSATDAQRRQLLLYAILIQRNFSEWPTAITIESASGETWPVAFSPEDAEKVLSEVLAAVEAYNRDLDLVDAAVPANPGKDTCHWCPYRVVCDPYWETLSVEWEHSSVRGELLGTGATPAGTNLMIRIQSPEELTNTILHVRGTFLAAITGAHRVSLVDAAATESPSVLRALWSTVIRLEIE
jgi:CRISPR/Cas system-associated exonuclease Cas4 (RecB family)